MEEVTKFDANFDLKNAVSSPTIESLDVLEDYIDFGIHSTIRKQMAYISEELEKHWAKVLLTNYLNGDSNAFTSSYGIRKNVATCGVDKIFQMFLKQAVERNACEEGVLHKLKAENKLEFICNDLTEKLIYCHYNNALELVKTNSEYQNSLIDNYIKFKYCSNIKKEISRIREEIPTSIFALNNLEQAMQSSSRKTSGEHKR